MTGALAGDRGPRGGFFALALWWLQREVLEEGCVGRRRFGVGRIAENGDEILGELDAGGARVVLRRGLGAEVPVEVPQGHG